MYSKNSADADTIKEKAATVVKSSRNNISRTRHRLERASNVSSHNCRNMSTCAALPFIFIIASALGGQSPKLGQSFWQNIAIAYYNKINSKIVGHL